MAGIMESERATERVPEFLFRNLPGIDDPYPIYAELRRASAVVKGGPSVWGVTRHADVSVLLRDRRLGHETFRPEFAAFTGDGPMVEFNRSILINRDPPDHTRLRTLMGKAFSASLVRKLRDQITDLVDELLEPVLDRGEFDVIADLAWPLPVRVICQMLGLPYEDRDMVRPWAMKLAGEDMDSAREALAWFQTYIDSHLAERTPDPEGDLLQRMLAAEDGDDALTHREIVDNVLLLFFAGYETTSNLIGNGCAALFEFPDQRDMLLANPDLAPSAVEEFLRYDSPIPFVQRLTLEPVEIGGRVIKAPRAVMLMLACANRDEEAFEDPDRLDITRSPNPHVAFGGGIHHCLGAQLARVEGDVVFRRLAERFATFEPAGDPVRRVSSIRSFATVPAKVTAAGR